MARVHTSPVVSSECLGDRRQFNLSRNGNIHTIITTDITARIYTVTFTLRAGDQCDATQPLCLRAPGKQATSEKEGVLIV